MYYIRILTKFGKMETFQYTDVGKYNRITYLKMLYTNLIFNTIIFLCRI